MEGGVIFRLTKHMILDHKIDFLMLLAIVGYFWSMPY